MAERICSISGCGKGGQLRRGWCHAHYERWRVHGDPLADNSQVRGICSVEACGRPHAARSFCIMHWSRWKKHGDPLYVAVDHPRWVGDAITYSGTHHRVSALRGPAKRHPCQHCGVPARHWAYDKTDPNERFDERGCAYSPDPDHYMPLCISCHWRFDGAALRLHAAASS